MQIQNTFSYYVDAKRADGRAPRTIADYHRCLTPFVDWCSSRALQPGELTRRHIREFVASFLRSAGWSDATVSIYIRNLRAFLSWIHTEGLTAANLATAVECPPQSIRVEPVLSEEELIDLLAACSDDEFARRDRAIILTMADTGFRIGEMAKLRRDQVHRQPEAGRAWIQALQPKTRKNGKGWRFAILGKSAAGALNRYLDTREDDDPALWLGRRGGLKTHGIRKMLYRRAKAAGLDPSRAHPHMFRKFFATQWLRSGGDEERLMLVGGWSTKEALEHYLDLARLTDIEAAHRAYGPVDKMLLDR